MKLTQLEVERLKPILKREATMIGGNREFAATLLNKMREVILIGDEDEVNILRSVAEHYDIDPKDIVGKSREMPIPEARKVASLLLHNHGCDTHRICNILNMHRTSYYHMRDAWQLTQIQKVYMAIKKSIRADK